MQLAYHDGVLLVQADDFGEVLGLRQAAAGSVAVLLTSLWMRYSTTWPMNEVT